MRNRAFTIALLATAVVGAACKKDEPKPGAGSGTASGTGGTQVTAPPRPSAGKLPTMPPLKLADDAKRAEKVALGHALFFDKRLSVDGSKACYSCHLNEDGNGGHDPTAIGPGGKALPRHAPVIWNVGFWINALAWDGRLPTLEAQAKAAIEGGNMGVGEGKADAKAAELGKIPGYAALFKAAFPGGKPNADLVSQALAEYERTLICADTAYDKFAAGDKAALNEAQQRGLDVFLGKGQCNVCHAPPFFSTAMNMDGGIYFNVGIGTKDVAKDKVDPGRMKVSTKDADWAAFKPPSLRNVSKSKPYFHDGSTATLEEAVSIMAGGGIPNEKLTPAISDRKLSAEEKADLVAFLGGLECPPLTEPKLP